MRRVSNRPERCVRPSARRSRCGDGRAEVRVRRARGTGGAGDGRQPRRAVGAVHVACTQQGVTIVEGRAARHLAVSPLTVIGALSFQAPGEHGRTLVIPFGDGRTTCVLSQQPDYLRRGGGRPRRGRGGPRRDLGRRALGRLRAVEPTRSFVGQDGRPCRDSRRPCGSAAAPRGAPAPPASGTRRLAPGAVTGPAPASSAPAQASAGPSSASGSSTAVRPARCRSPMPSREIPARLPAGREAGSSVS